MARRSAGDGAVTLAALLGALKVVGKEKDAVRISMVGAGAANIALFKILVSYGVPPANIIMVDTKGIIDEKREDLRVPGNEEKLQVARETNREGVKGGIPESMEGADVCIAFSGPGIIKPEWVESMAKDAIVFSCANPVPEIWPWEATEAGARIVATGRSDFPNQVNNSLGFPGLFRGVLDVGATKITDGMCNAAAEELLSYAEDNGLSEDCIIPSGWTPRTYTPAWRRRSPQRRLKTAWRG